MFGARALFLHRLPLFPPLYSRQIPGVRWSHPPPSREHQTNSLKSSSRSLWCAWWRFRSSRRHREHTTHCRRTTLPVLRGDVRRVGCLRGSYAILDSTAIFPVHWHVRFNHRRHCTGTQRPRVGSLTRWRFSALPRSRRLGPPSVQIWSKFREQPAKDDRTPRPIPAIVVRSSILLCRPRRTCRVVSKGEHSWSFVGW